MRAAVSIRQTVVVGTTVPSCSCIGKGVRISTGTSAGSGGGRTIVRAGLASAVPESAASSVAQSPNPARSAISFRA